MGKANHALFIIGLLMMALPVVKMVSDFWAYASDMVMGGGVMWVIGIAVVIVAYAIKDYRR
jgi:hypothetical protein